MSFADPNPMMPWSLDAEQAAPLFRQAVELGITFWDTANAYGGGTSEVITGNAMREYSTREGTVLATKLYWPMHAGPGGGGLSRKAILEQVDASLTRLGTDYVDLLQIHRFDPTSRSRRPWRPCTTSSRPARSATSVPPRCGRGSSPRCSTQRS